MDLASHGLVPSDRRPEIPGGGPQSVADLLARPVVERPDAEALVGRHCRFTYAELDAAVTAAAGALWTLGVRPGERVAASLPNDPDIVVAFLAAMRLGAIWVGINRTLAAPEKAYMLRDAEVGVFLGDETTAAQVSSADLPDLRHAVTVDRTAFASEGLGVGDAEAPAVDVDPFAPAAIAYTSGTTGFPKGAVHSQHNLLLPGAVTVAGGAALPAGRTGVCLPLTLLNLMILGPCVTAQVGSCLVCMDRIDALGLAEWIRTERVETFAAVPAMLHDLLTHPDVSDDDLASLTRPGVGGADLPESFRELYRERFGAEIVNGYGLTEAPTTVAATDPERPPVPNETGFALPQVEIHVVGPDGADLPAGEVGEICVAPRREGPWAGVYTPMLGYWNKPEATAEALAGGMLHTGDLGCLDDGRLFVKDRRHDLIIRGGANVYPAEVERVLQSVPGVRRCAVLGRPDERLGEEVVAFVEVEGARDAGALLEHCRANLARYKVPAEVVFVDEWPLTPMGKIRKTDLRARL